LFSPLLHLLICTRSTQDHHFLAGEKRRTRQRFLDAVRIGRFPVQTLQRQVAVLGDVRVN
jgi:hypothetical protein